LVHHTAVIRPDQDRDVKGTKIALEESHHAVRLIVPLPSSVQLLPGSWVALADPVQNWPRIFRSVFYSAKIEWWSSELHENSESVKFRLITLLLIQKDHKHSDVVVQPRIRLSDKASTLSAVIYGPYGGFVDTDKYNTVFMFASGTGLSGMLPYIRYFIDAVETDKPTPGKVYLKWEVLNRSE
jgi:hypothetical protein